MIAQLAHLMCPNGHGEMVASHYRDVVGCPQCGWGVSGLELHVQRSRRVAEMVADKAIGREDMLRKTDSGGWY